MNSYWEMWCLDMHRVVEGLAKKVEQMKQEQIIE